MLRHRALSLTARRLLAALLLGLALSQVAGGASADPAGRTGAAWVPPVSGYADRAGPAEWGWPACTCNPQEYRGPVCATGRDPVCGGDPGSLGGIWEWQDQPGYWEPFVFPEASVSASLACLPGANGWCRSAATLTLTGHEPLAGYAITSLQGERDAVPFAMFGDTATLVIGDTAGTTVTYRAHSSFGDSSYPGATTVRVDTTAPTVSVAIAGPAGTNGWYTGPVQVTVSGADAASGLAALYLDGAAYTGPRLIAAEGQTTLPVAAADNAGNLSGAQPATVKIDSVPPAAAHELAGTPGEAGWFVSPVQVTISGSDATSGVAALTLDGSPYAGPRTYAAEGEITVTYAARDMAGQASAPQTALFRVDTTPPAVSAAVSGPAGDSGWYLGPVTVEVSGADATSGLAALTLDGQPYLGPREYAAEGATAYTFSARDAAGNLSAAGSATVRIDATAPALDLAVAGTPGRNGWFVSPVTVTLTGQDAVSGLAGLELGGAVYTSPQVLGAEGVNTVAYAGRDVAGNRAAGSRAFGIDTQPPTVTATLSGQRGAQGWYVSPVTITLSGSDAASGLNTLALNGAPYSGPWVVQAQGEGAFTFSGQDQAGNRSGTLAGLVRIDTVAPVVTATLAGQLGANGWYVSPVTVTLAAADTTSGVAGLSLDDLPYTAPRVFSDQGQTTVGYTAADVADNHSAEQRQVFRIDTRPPATRPTLIGLPGRSGWYLGPVLVVLSAEDATSGVDHVLLDGQPYTGPRLFPSGVVTTTYQAVDRAGNVEPVRTLVFNADGTPPATTATLAGTRGENGWFTSAVTVSLAARDDLSGVVQVWLNGQPGMVQSLDTDGLHPVAFAAEDLAGNRAITQTLTVRIDQAPPEVAVLAMPGQGGGLVVDVQAHDAGSGVQGGMVGILVDGQLVQCWNFAGESAHVEWDGALPDGRSLPPGAYTVWAAAHDAAGLKSTASTGAMLAPAATLPPAPTQSAPVSSQPTTPPLPPITLEPEATARPDIPSPTATQVTPNPVIPQPMLPATPRSPAHMARSTAGRGVPGWWWMLVTLIPALALAIGAVWLLDPRPCALGRLSQIAAQAEACLLGDFDD